MTATPYTDAEAAEARQWSNRHGPPNSWTAGNGTAARMIGRLLDEREKLMAMQASGGTSVRDNCVAGNQPEMQYLRDTFAAAALTGLLAGRTYTGFDDAINVVPYAAAAYDIADAMLRERANHTPSTTQEPPMSDPASGPQVPRKSEADTFLGKKVVNTDMPLPDVRGAGNPPSDVGTGDTQEPVAWAALNRDGTPAWLSYSREGETTPQTASRVRCI